MGSESITTDSEGMRARRTIVFVKSNKLVKNIEAKQLWLVKKNSFLPPTRQRFPLVGYNI